MAVCSLRLAISTEVFMGFLSLHAKAEAVLKFHVTTTVALPI
jgi:hypothetical protein